MNVAATKASFIRCSLPPDSTGESVRAEQPGNVRPDTVNRSEVLKPGRGIDSFLKVFTVTKSIYSAEISACALGIFDLFVNGRRIGRDELKPGWTDYSKRVFVYTYDLSTCIRPGENVIYARVSPGWYGGRISHGRYGGSGCAFLCGVDITYDDGEREYIFTDASWKSAVTGPVLFADIWDGEYYDARIGSKELYDLSEWSHAEIVPDIQCEPENPVGPTVRARKDLNLKPVSGVVYRGAFENGTDFGEIRAVSKKRGEGCETAVIEPEQTFLLDFAQNIAGRPVITVRAARGTRIVMRFGEMLNDSGRLERGNDGPRGSLYLANHRSAVSQAVYVCRGDGDELYYPTHTFFGFRYMEIEADATAAILNVIGEVLGSDIREVSSFRCSDDDVNALVSNILWTQRSNFVSVPTDCPQRDERLGWTGDALAFCQSACYNADVRSFFRKWLCDCRDSQSEDGTIADVIPLIADPGTGNSNNAAWADAVISVPYTLSRFYGDRSFIDENYQMMQKYIERLSLNTPPGPNAHYGDWLSPNETYELGNENDEAAQESLKHSEKELIALCFYARDAMMMARMAAETERFEDSVTYTRLFERLKSDFNEKYIHDGRITVRTQTACALALCSHLVDGETKLAVATTLGELVDSVGGAAVGFVGVPLLMNALTENGMSDKCYQALLADGPCSWLIPVRSGATTVWERPDSYSDEKGFADCAMNSFNHCAFGSVLEWLFAGMTGISPDEYGDGFKNFTYRPHPDLRDEFKIPRGQKRITSAHARLDTDSGTITARWNITAGCVVYSLTVPAGCTARCELPARGRMLSGSASYDEQAGIYTSVIGEGEHVFAVAIEK